MTAPPARPRRAAATTIALALLALALPAVLADTGDETPETHRVAGANRYATAAAIATDTFAAPVAEAVLARGDRFPDALTGTYLAGAVEGPILLTPPAALDGDALAALQSLDVQTVHILGGEAAVSAAVEAELEANGFSVNRVAGANRYETARKVAEAPDSGRVARLGGKRTALLASGENFPDSIAAGAVAYRAGLPLLLTPKESLAAEAKAAMANLGIEHVVVLGGPAAVSDGAVAAIEGATTRRVGGATRSETAAALADFALDELGWDARQVSLARHDLFPDGLAAGPHAGRAFSPILLTPPTALASAVERWLHRHHPETARVVAFGGEAAVSEPALDAAAAAAGTAGPNQAYEIDADPETLALGASRTCTVHTPRGATVHLRLVPAASAFTGASGRTLFKDTSPADRLADTDPTPASITAVNGGAVQTDSVGVPTGTLTVTISSSQTAHAVLVAFSDRHVGYTPQALDLANPAFGSPLEPFGVGCDTRWFPPEAPLGTHTSLTVQRVDIDGGMLVAAPSGGSPLTFRFREGDEHSPGQFASAVSASDVIDVDYRLLNEGASRFTITFDDVIAPPKPHAELVGGDVVVWFAPPGDNGTGTTFRMVRRPTTRDSGGNCTSSAGSEQPVETVSEPPAVDRGAPSGCWVYQVWAQSAGVRQRVSPPSNVVEVPAPDPSATAPTSTEAGLTDAAPVGEISGGDVLTITFDKPMARPRPGTSITLRGSDALEATVTHGDNALFTLDAAGTTLTVALTRDPRVVASFPAEAVNHVGVADRDGNLWNIAGSPARTFVGGG